MPRRILRLVGDSPDHAPPDGAALRAGFDRIRAEVGAPLTFPPEVLAEAARTAAAPQAPPGSQAYADRLDATELPLVTIDPPGSTDLDQAVHVERRARGYRVRYAIADVAAFVPPGGPLDAEAHRRVETLYAPDERTPLHPPVLSEDAASLLPRVDRPALLWTIDLDADGATEDVEVRRALVRSREQLDYAGVQDQLDAGRAAEPLELLAEVGRLLDAREVARGGVTLPTPEQRVEPEGASYALRFRRPLPVEGWNAHISLLTGTCAAGLMIDAGVGVLRTLPPPPEQVLALFRRAAGGLGVALRDDEHYADVVRRLDPEDPPQAALLQEATGLLRGAGYTVVAPGQDEAERSHAALASPYAHVTAPLRRLVDRYAGEVCLAVHAGAPVPEWVLAALPGLPAEMAASDRRAGELERAVVDLVEAAVLAPRVGEVFAAMVLDVTSTGASVLLRDLPVRARAEGAGMPLGAWVRLRLEEASVEGRRVRFVPVPDEQG